MKAQPNIQIVIPARLASSRLPEKLLLRETGKTVLHHTFESASQAASPSGIIIAVDHQRLFDEVTAFGGKAQMTDPNAPSGTDRIAEVAAAHLEVDIFVNVQGDEPEIAAQAIDQVAKLLADHPEADVATLASPIRDRQCLNDPSTVKVVVGHDSRALYFSRSPIPHVRNWNDACLTANPPNFLHHLGIYAYRREFLLNLASLPPSPLEQLEKLEQLRFLQAGRVILVGTVAYAAAGIDTAEDYAAFVRRQMGR